MKSVVFVRHGESAANARGPAIEHGSIPLTEFGHMQARSIVSRLPVRPGLVLVSPMIRTQQTAAPYSDSLGVDVAKHPARCQAAFRRRAPQQVRDTKAYLVVVEEALLAW